MAKKALLDVLEQTIGKYVLNLDAESLNVAVWSGKIELNNLELNVNAVNAELDRQALDIPFRVISGQFLSFQVDVPWAHLMSRSVVLRANGLKVSVEPYDRSASTEFLLAPGEHESEAARKMQQQREKSIQAADDFRVRANALRKLAEQDLEAINSERQSNANASFGARLVRRIVENIQIDISDVQVTIQGSDCSAGAVLENLQLVTTDKDGQRTFVDRTSSLDVGKSFLYKVLQIKGLGIYIDDDGLSQTNLSSIREDDEPGLDHNYVLAPLSFEAKLRQSDSNVCVDYPKYLLESELSSLSILISKAQLELADKIMKQIEPGEGVPHPLFPEYRPLSRVTAGNAKEWWHYAFRCIGRMNGRHSWVEFFRAFQIRKKYITLYKRNVNSQSASWLSALSADELNELESIESDRSICIEGLMTWRNIADAQFERERGKHQARLASERGSLFTSLFGSTQKKAKSDADSDPPITLNVDELKELEVTTMQQVAQAELTSDSRLYDLKFVLGSFQIHMTSYDLRPIISLEMGIVELAFDARADGSYNASFKMMSLHVTDRITPNTLFPQILKNQERGNEKNMALPAFYVILNKAASGDQSLEVRLDTFEAIASPNLAMELRQFFNFSKIAAAKSKKQNPLLAQSLSGSVDLFYDAEGGAVSAAELNVPDYEDSWYTDKQASDKVDLSSALIDAWKAKTESNANWTVNLDLQAPILIVPENCLDPHSSVLVFDLGHLTLEYGNIDSEPNVNSWFEQSSPREVRYDSGRLIISSLAFSVGNASNWQRLVRKHEFDARNSEDAVIEPISLSVYFGIEISGLEHMPMICAFGAIPSIGFIVSPSQVSRVLSVANAWRHLLVEMNPEIGARQANDDSNAALGTSLKRSESIEEARTAKTPASIEPESSRLLISIGLRRLSVKVRSTSESCVEAHLVAVSASLTRNTHGVVEARLSMGWFWILDMLENAFPRRQRLLAHSSLPVSSIELARDGKYDVMTILESLGVFSDHFEGCSDLADISVRQLPERPTHTDPFATNDWMSCQESVDLHIDAKFSGLFVNWNPKVIQVVVSVAAKFADLASTMDTNGTILLSTKATGRRRSLSGSASAEETRVVRRSRMLAKVEMQGFEVSLRSAKDDLPLFVMAVASVNLAFLTDDTDSALSLDLGDFSVKTTSLGRTVDAYRSMIGLAPGGIDCLLKVEYLRGQNATKRRSPSNYEAFCEVGLSPMRMVYIHAQVMALVEYASEGMLGAVTSNAASTAVAAAAEIANSTTGTVFFIKGTGIDVIVPKAAYHDDFIAVKAGEMNIEYKIMPNDQGAESYLSLVHIRLEDNEGTPLQVNPIKMDVAITIPSEGVGAKVDQAMVVKVNMSHAKFILTRPSYLQVLATISSNMGEADLFLRDESASADSVTGAGTADFASISHAGVVIVENLRHVYVTFTIAELSLEINGSDPEDNIARIAAVDTVLNLDMLPDQETTRFKASLKNLVCNDERLKSIGRQHRSLVYQQSHCKQSDLFALSYESSGLLSTRISMSIGSPCIVLIPDAISEILSFVRMEEIVDRPGADTALQMSDINKGDQLMVGPGLVETSLQKLSDALPTSSFEVALKTERCTIILVDLGSDVLQTNSSFSLPVSSVAESIVLAGQFEGSLKAVTDIQSGSMTSFDTEWHGNSVEAYSASGSTLQNPIQVVDPASFSVFVNGTNSATEGKKLDIRCAFLSPIDVSFSFRNLALVNTILSSALDCLAVGDDENGLQNNSVDHVLSQHEAAHIEELTHILEDDGHESSVHHERESAVNEVDSEPRDTGRSHQPCSSVSVSVKVTLPLTQITIINDLQGLDEALIRCSLRSFVGSGSFLDSVLSGPGQGKFLAFDFQMHMSALAGYFDATANRWKTLLLKPWELSAKGGRGRSLRFNSTRPSTTIDIESMPCHLSFSEQFLMSLASACQMWNVYTSAAESKLDPSDKIPVSDNHIKRSMAASAVRSFVISMPYAIENQSGECLTFIVHGEKEKTYSCDHGFIEYFRFQPPSGTGSGGKRLYGQDMTFQKSITVLLGHSRIRVDDIDDSLGALNAHLVGENTIIYTKVAREGKTTVIHISSGADIYNMTMISFDVFSINNTRRLYAGTSVSSRPHGTKSNFGTRKSIDSVTGKLSKQSKKFSIPLSMIADFVSQVKAKRTAFLNLQIEPQIDRLPTGWSLRGDLSIEFSPTLHRDRMEQSFEIFCRPVCNEAVRKGEERYDPTGLVVRAFVIVLVSNQCPSIDIGLYPRAIIRNDIPVCITVRTPMPYVVGSTTGSSLSDSDKYIELPPRQHLQIFTPGPSVAVTIKCTDNPVGGTATDWMQAGWVDLPLLPEFRLQEPFLCSFPFSRRTTDPLALAGSKGSEFFIVQGNQNLGKIPSAEGLSSGSGRQESGSIIAHSSHVVPTEDDWREFYITVANYAVDHTGEVLFEQVEAAAAAFRRSSSDIPLSRRSQVARQVSAPFGAYGSNQYNGRLSLLPQSYVPIRLLHLTMQGDEGVKRSSPFRIDDLSIAEGGLDSTPISWEDGTASGFFAYRRLSSNFTSEVHIIPEYVVFNGSSNTIVQLRHPGGPEVSVKPGSIVHFRTQNQGIAIISLYYSESNLYSQPVRVDSLGLRFVIVKNAEGTPVGSIAVQTVTGARDSRLVVKLGELKLGSNANIAPSMTEPSPLQSDFIRFRIQWSWLSISLMEARSVGKKYAFFETALDRIRKQSEVNDGRCFPSPSKTEGKWVESRDKRIPEDTKDSENPVCTVLLDRFTIDWQRVYKEDANPTVGMFSSPERSQFSVIVHNVQLKDDNPDSPYPVVFDSTSSISFFDLCIRFRGPTKAELVKVDLFDLNLAHKNGQSEKIIINTYEDFVWKLLDLADRILMAASEFAGVQIELEWNSEEECYSVTLRDKVSYLDEGARYTPPRSDVLYDIKNARVSPFVILLSFKRTPQESRYKLLRGVKGAALMNYFTRHLKFKIDKAELKFAPFERHNIRGPPDRLAELIATVYFSRMKMKFITIMTAASLQDWKFLAAREGGDDDFVEGDILRATGNLAGRTASYVFGQAGRGLGTGVKRLTSKVGEGIETASGAIGARAVGAGVSSVVSGVGEGVGDTITGVGSGAGKVLKGAGQGLGHVFGGVTGGALMIGKGIGKGLTTGDGRAVASGLAQGVTSVGSGVGQGVESVVSGTAEGALTIGHGLFSGLKSVGKGVGGAIIGKKPSRKKITGNR